MNAESTRILFVQNNLSTRLPNLLRNAGYDVRLEVLVSKALNRLAEDRPTLVILDASTLGKQGLSVCRSIRKCFEGGILVLSDGNPEDEADMLEAGADSFLAVPFHPRLFIARTKSLLRTSSRGSTDLPSVEFNRSEPRQIVLGDFTIDSGSRTVLINGGTTDLTSAEFDLLWLLASHPGEIVTRDQIYAELRGVEYNGLERAVDLRVARLRKKIGDNGRNPQRIKSIRSVGYQLTVRNPDRSKSPQNEALSHHIDRTGSF